MDKLLSTSQVAQVLGVNVRTVQRLARRGEFPNAFRVSKRWLIPQLDLDDYIKKRKAKAPG